MHDADIPCPFERKLAVCKVCTAEREVSFCPPLIPQDCRHMQAAGSSSAREDIAAQLKAWEQHRLTAKMEPALVDIYQLLSGNPEPVIARLKLDWRRALGLYLW